MILPLAFLLGFGFGVLRARRRGGGLADRLQYGAAHGIAALLLALFATLALDALGVF